MRGAALHPAPKAAALCEWRAASILDAVCASYRV